MRQCRSDAKAMSARGISLIEVLLACALVAVVGGAIASLAGPLRTALARSEGAAQLEPSGRAALETMTSDLREGGADPDVADQRWRLSPLILAATPLPDLDSTDPVNRGSALRVRRTLSGAAQGVLAADAAAGSAILLLETAARCAGGPPACNFTPGDIAIVYDGAAADSASVFAIGAGTVVLTRPLANAFPRGAVVATVDTTRYGTRVAADGSRRLVRISAGGAEQPMLDNVADFEVTSDTGDPSQATRISIRLRLEAPLSSLRGPAGYLFRRPGNAVDARQWLPDVQMLFTVALRNPTGAG
jgi:hypothetical protein